MIEFPIVVWYLFFVFGVGPFLFWLAGRKPKKTYKYGDAAFLSALVPVIFGGVVFFGYILWITGKHLLELI